MTSLSLTDQTAEAYNWRIARAIIPKIEETFRRLPNIDFSFERWDRLALIIEHYLPRTIGESDSLSEGEQTEVLSMLSAYIRMKDRLISRRRQRLMLALLVSLGNTLGDALAFLEVKEKDGFMRGEER